MYFVMSASGLKLWILIMLLLWFAGFIQRDPTEKGGAVLGGIATAVMYMVCCQSPMFH